MGDREGAMRLLIKGQETAHDKTTSNDHGYQLHGVRLLRRPHLRRALSTPTAARPATCFARTLPSRCTAARLNASSTMTARCAR